MGKLIDLVVNEATVPFIPMCAAIVTYMSIQMLILKWVESIVLNAKTQRPSVCNSIENLLLHRDFFDQYGKEIPGVLSGANIGIYGEAIAHINHFGMQQ
ncbi:aldehyde dehydrogenase family protein [Heyndrickxia oleronia]|uniref:hypothetical protein n=1 Tax=Heyndrickxia oleronia TaxID=38875 RepID=UPI00375285A1